MGRDRLVAASRGGAVDARPVIAPYQGADGLIVPVPEVSAQAGGEAAILADVLNPFGRARQRGVDLNALLQDQPAEGEAELAALVTEAHRDMESALRDGADGIFYRLQGAEPSLCTPMQYGGHYLERDRELLQQVAEARLNVIFVDAEADAYLDFLSDLPGHVFAWRSQSSALTLDDVRRLRAGALASDVSGTDVELVLTESAGPWSASASRQTALR
jgi:hypothetical protein